MDKTGGLFHVIRHLALFLCDDPASYSASSARWLLLRRGFADGYFLYLAVSSVITAVLLLRLHFPFKADSGRLYPFVFPQAGHALLHSLLECSHPLLLFRSLTESGGGKKKRREKESRS
jgi:hypothetical protein